MATKIALLGTGLMGAKVCKRLMSLGSWSVRCWNRTAEKSERLAEFGAEPCATPAEAVQGTQVIVLFLADAAAIRSVLMEDPSVRPQLKDKVVLQMGTIGPKESAALALDILAAGGSYVEAPVLGSQPEAEKGTLLVMVGAEADPREPGSPHHSTVWPLLRALGQESNIHFIGPVGTGAAVKLALNQLIASLTVGFSTSLGLVQRSGADVDKFMSILRASALYAPTYDKKLQKMLDRDYGAANFPTKHLLKDVRLFETEAAAAGLDTRLLAALKGVVQDTVDRGLANTDYSAVFDAVAHPGEQQQATKPQQ
eukprot:XP_001692084.1 3-hydroxyacid dehydrogenase [Chlamydomonas reinhardtii]